MFSYLLTIAYDGTAYSGWQRQSGFSTVQEELENAAGVLAGQPVVVHGSGRTDAGVHALRQCAHVRMPVELDPSVFCRALNGNLPRDIAVRSVRRVPATFHARFSAIGKRYLYRFRLGQVRPVFGREHFWWVRRELDVGAMRRAARAIVGRHDFAAFASNPGYERSRGTVRHVQHLHLIRRPHGLDMFIQGDGFLYNMVRAIAGTLIDVATGKYPPEHVAAILADGRRAAAGATAPAAGLFLLRVLYASESLGSRVADEGLGNALHVPFAGG